MSSAAYQKALQRAWRTRSAHAAPQNSAKTDPNACNFPRKFCEFFALNAPHVSNFRAHLLSRFFNECQQSLQNFCGQCARRARQNRAESHAKPRDFRSKPAHFGAQNARKQPQIAFKSCTDAVKHLQNFQKHFSVHRALAARLSAARKNAAKTDPLGRFWCYCV